MLELSIEGYYTVEQAMKEAYWCWRGIVPKDFAASHRHGEVHSKSIHELRDRTSHQRNPAASSTFHTLGCTLGSIPN